MLPGMPAVAPAPPGARERGPAQVGYSSSFSVLLQSDTGLAGIAEGWYWAAALTAGFVVTAVWYHRAGRTGPGWPYLVIALALWGLARHARSRPLAIAALAYTVAVLVAALLSALPFRLRGQLRAG